MITTNVPTLKIHKLTQEQYERELNAGNIDANALYLTPDEGSDLVEYATTEYVDSAVDNAKTTVDTALSSTSNNPVANSVLSAELESITNSMNAFEQAIDNKADSVHGHGMEDINGLADAMESKSDSDHGHEMSGIAGLVNALSGKAESGHNHDSTYAKFIAPLTTGSCDDINVPLAVRDLRTNNDELFNMFDAGGSSKRENTAYIITLFFNHTNADASKVQIAVGYTWGTMATRAYYGTSGWKPWVMQMGNIIHPYFTGSSLPEAGTKNRIFFKTE